MSAGSVSGGRRQGEAEIPERRFCFGRRGPWRVFTRPRSVAGLRPSKRLRMHPTLDHANTEPWLCRPALVHPARVGLGGKLGKGC